MIGARSLIPSSVAPERWLFRYSGWDVWFISLAVLHALLLLTQPPFWVIGIAFWWNANTIAHNFIHRPFFTSADVNRVFSVLLSLVLGIPQTLWQQRHLAHHSEREWRCTWTSALKLETLISLGLWTWLGVVYAPYFLGAYLPGLCLGLGLCWLQGYFEHHGGTTSHYGWWYNLLFFNDGFHVEHHSAPRAHWRQLPQLRSHDNQASRWPAIFRWLEAAPCTVLNGLERCVLRCPGLQAFVVARHREAFQQLLRDLPPIRRVGIVGGGIFPRSALVLRHLLPEADLRIIDASRANLDCARLFIPTKVEFVHQFFDANRPGPCVADLDLIVIPLAFRGDRSWIYRHPPAPIVLMHDWVWRIQPQGAVVSLALLKRLNMVRR
jgi:hypothetical protein